MKINAIYQLLKEPNVYLSTGTSEWHRIPRARDPGFMLCHPMWFFGPKSALLYVRMARLLEERNIKLILLHNSRLELTIGSCSGLPSHLLNQNMHVCEHWFTPCGCQRVYDAVYTAAAAKYKRIHLALDVPRLFVLTYFWPEVRDTEGKWRLSMFDQRLAGVVHNTDRVPLSDVPKVLCSAGCGLALSRVEGAMWASMEYLMCGLPVVTTWNLGGRDFYLNESNSIRVGADRTSVKAGVMKASSRCAGAGEIRDGVMAKVRDQRGAFVELVAKLSGRSDVAAVSDCWWAAPSGIHAHRIL